MQEGTEASEAAVLAQKGTASQGYCKGSSSAGSEGLAHLEPKDQGRLCLLSLVLFSVANEQTGTGGGHAEGAGQWGVSPNSLRTPSSTQAGAVVNSDQALY